MSWDAVGVISAAIAAAVSANNYVLKLHLEAAMGRQAEQLKTWINGSFLRAKEVQAHITALEARIEKLERN